MSSNAVVVNEEIYNKEYRRLRTLTSQTDIVEGSVSVASHQNPLNHYEWELHVIPTKISRQMLIGFVARQLTKFRLVMSLFSVFSVERVWPNRGAGRR